MKITSKRSGNVVDVADWFGDRKVASGRWLASERSAAPPKSGSGSGRAAWAAYAGSLGVDVADDMTRDDIIDAVEG